MVLEIIAGAQTGAIPLVLWYEWKIIKNKQAQLDRQAEEHEECHKEIRDKLHSIDVKVEGLRSRTGIGDYRE